MNFPKIKIDPNKMDYIEKGAGGSRRFQYTFCGIIILILLLTKLLFASELTLEETKDMLGGDPYRIARWMENIKSVHGSFGYGQLPERTFKYRKGDCEDYAILAQYFLRDKYETYIIVWRGKFREDSIYYAQMKERLVDHCVVALFDGTNWGIIDQNKYITNGKNLANIIKKNCDLRRIHLEKAFIMDLLKLRRKIIEEIDLGE